ncbi:MAG: IclR family transcriptional regulator [Ruminiclostridium sp.]
MNIIIKKNAEHHPTLRVLNVLEAVSQSKKGMTLTELSVQMQVPKSTLFPIVHTLLEESFLSYNSTTMRYLLGVSSFEVGQRYLEQIDLLQNIKDEMKCIVGVCGETCHLAILESGDVLYLHKEDSPETIRMVSSVGRRLPAYGTGIGKALLSDHDLKSLKKIYPDGLTALTEYTVTDFTKLAEQLKDIHVSGVAFEKEESNLHIQCLAVPIKRNDKIIAALSVAVPTFRAGEDKMELIRRLLVNAREKIESMFANSNINLSQLQ